MKRKNINFILIGFLAFFIIGCLGERSLKDEDSADSTDMTTENVSATIPDEAMCFLRTDGTKHQDSTYVYIRLKGDSVSGIHHWVPDLKDARRGVITGTKRGDTIDVVWNYTQEGISDTLHTVFLMEDGLLKQQAYAVREDGRQVLDPNAPFDIIYNPTDCPKFE
ncbi:hypothetical protein [Albibacterium profundi]|uniref:Lipoprotein n=1 Tax=Albibacterium profundi TaxID=3134906 RepID=A0ABV5CHC0_9SPHI